MTSTFFDFIQKGLEHEAELRENIRNSVKDLEVVVRAALSKLNKMHTTEVISNQSSLASLMSGIEATDFVLIREKLKKLADLIPKHAFFRYNEMFSRTMQQIVFLVAVVHFVKDSKLVEIEQMQAIIGIPLAEDTDAFHLTLEDFLHGLVSMASELARMAVTSVIAGDFDRPIAISAFVEEMYCGFQLLNLKNDSLRKRFDSMKYEIKKIEEVVYNIKLRGLSKGTGSSAAAIQKQ
jgi:predicted translin family RNA/ssDNA-binding protein